MKKRKTHGRNAFFRGVVLFLFVSCFASALSAQTKVVSGLVKDASGNPLPGVTVYVNGTKLGTTTNQAGEYSMPCTKNDVLRFEFMGFDTQMVPVGERTVINVALAETTVAIDEVVVLGYGASVKRLDVIGSVTSVNADDIEQRATVNLFEALQGQMAGVQITSESGAPEADVNMSIRGVSTLTNNGASPLYIVDGMVMESIDHINPSDIQGIDILKDAASAAIYGARAANGVVMITTKQAQEGKMSVNLRYLQEFGYLANTLPQINNKQYLIFQNTVMSANSKDQFKWFGTDATDSLNLKNNISYNYQDLVTQVAKRTEAGLSANGGTKITKFYTSLNYLDQQGIILTSYVKRFNFQTKVDYKPSKVFRTSTNVQASYREYRQVNTSSILYNAMRRPPYLLLYFPTDGNYIPSGMSYPNTGKTNPMIVIYEQWDITKRYDISLNQEIQLFITPHLNLIGRASTNLYYSEREKYSSPWNQSSVSLIDAGKDALTLTDVFNRKYQVETFINYSRKIDKHFVRAMLGASTEDLNQKTTSTGGNYLLDSDIRVPQASSDPSTATVTPNIGYSIASMFSRFEYNWNSRYLFSATLRRDGSSRFGSETRWGWFPAVQAGWRFSDHLSDIPWFQFVQNAKLRITWGRVGNDRIGNYDSQTLLSGNIGSGYDDNPGTVPTSQYGNQYLKWEETTSTNFGLDFNLLKGRINVTADYYIKKTTDMLDSDNLPLELGYSSMRVNIGSVRNRGVELDVKITVVRNKNWMWRTSLNWSKNKNTVLAIAGEGGRIVSSYWWVEPGQPAGLFYGFKHQGVYAYDVSNAYTSDFSERLIPVFERDQYGNVRFDAERQPVLTGYQYQDGRNYNGEVKQMYIGTTLAKGGDVIWEDYNRDGTITDTDKQILGCAYPDWFAGWNNSIRWKNLTLDFSFYHQHGGLIYNYLLWQLSSYRDGTSNCDPRPLIQGWRFQGQITDWFVPGNNARSTENNRQLSSFYLEDASFIRLSNVRLTYRFSNRLASKLFTKGLQCYVYGKNLLTWTNYRGYDPELGGKNVLTPGQDNQKYPRNRSIGFGVNVNF